MEYVSIRTSTLRGDQRITFDVYVQVAGKQIHYLRQGDSFEGSRLARLKQKGFSPELSLSTVNFLRDKGFIDDRVFAKGWVASRLKRPYGLRRIKQELVAKGLDKEIIEDALSAAGDDYSESRIVGQLAKERFSRQKGIEPQKAKARVYGYLLRRGFPPDIVSDIVKQYDS